MAASQSNSLKGLQAIDEELLTCTICMEHFDKPKVLPCHHTFCQHCLEPQVVNTKINCPICRKTCTVQSGHAADLPNDFRVSQIKDILGCSMSWEKKCDVCQFNQMSKPADKYCVDCSKHLCGECTVQHQRNKHFASHSLVDMTATTSVQCSIHAPESYTLYCTQCETLVCMVCVMTQCADHDTKDIHDTYDQLKAPIKDTASRLLTLAKTLENPENRNMLDIMHFAKRRKAGKMFDTIREHSNYLVEKIRMNEIELCKKASSKIRVFEDEMTRYKESVHMLMYVYNYDGYF